LQSVRSFSLRNLKCKLRILSLLAIKLTWLPVLCMVRASIGPSLAFNPMIKHPVDNTSHYARTSSQTISAIFKVLDMKNCLKMEESWVQMILLVK